MYPRMLYPHSSVSAPQLCMCEGVSESDGSVGTRILQFTYYRGEVKLSVKLFTNILDVLISDNADPSNQVMILRIFCLNRNLLKEIFLLFVFFNTVFLSELVLI